MIEKPYLVHWSDDSDSNTETTATLEEAQAEIDRWLDLRRGDATDGWPLDMSGYIAVIVEHVAEEESEAPEWSSFDRHVDYYREKVPDPQAARLSALEAENAGLKAQLANATDNYREAWAALRMVRDALEEVGPVGCLPASEHLPDPTPTAEGAELAAGISRLAYGAGLTVDRDALSDAISEAIGSRVYVCSRDWGAWQHGTMDRDDFREFIYSGGCLDEVVDAVVGVLKVVTDPAPLRLGRGPTLEEVRAHADVAGKWLFSLTIDDNDDADSAVYWEQCTAWVVDGVINHDSIITGGRIVDAIPLNAARQPCGVTP